MEIQKIRTMRGPNYWSAEHHHLIVLEIESDPEQERAREVIVSRILEAEPGLQGLGEASDLRALMGVLAVGLQRSAGLSSEMFVPEEATSGMVIFTYEFEAAGVHAAKASLRVLNEAAAGKEVNIKAEIEILRNIKRRSSMGPSTGAIADEARRRGIPVTRLNNSSLTRLGQGKNIRHFQAAVTSGTGVIASDIARNKFVTKDILKNAKVPVPEGFVISCAADLPSVLSKLGYPVAVKPLNGNHGRGITTGLTCYERVLGAFELARKISGEVIVERHIEGFDHRFLVINYKLAAVARRVPACVQGNGHSTIRELIGQVNNDPQRGEGHENMLTKIRVDDQSMSLLEARGLTLDSVLADGELLYLKTTANLSTGGTAEDVTDEVHPYNVFLAERIARLLNLDICGIDIMVNDVGEPITSKNGAILEVNSGPGLRMHMAPSSGKGRNVAANIIDMLYPSNSTSRIPVVAVTGTNGKTTTTRLLSHLAAVGGFTPGFTSTDGVYINGFQINEGDCSGPQSASVVLSDPIVDFAVLECARGGILRSGLGFDGCDVSIVTNVSEDHLGIGGIDTIRQLARLKAVVPKSTFASGYAVLNADDELVYAMREGLKCNVALFAMSAEGDRIREHVALGRPAAYVSEGCLYIAAGGEQHLLACVKDVPLSYEGNSECMIKNILAASLGAFVSGIPVETIQKGLMTFIPSAETTPGRMNHFDFPRFKVLLDYAHNESGYLEIRKYFDRIQASRKLGIIGAPGDRRDEDIRVVGEIAGMTFDEIIIRHDVDMRGRTREEVTTLLTDGIRRVNKTSRVKVIADVNEAIRYAFDQAPDGAWLFVNSENVAETTAYLQELQKASTMKKAS